MAQIGGVDTSSREYYEWQCQEATLVLQSIEQGCSPYDDPGTSISWDQYNENLDWWNEQYDTLGCE